MPVTLDNLRDVFSYHAPEVDQIARYQAIREAAHDLALVILENAPLCADQQAALRHVRDATMSANAAIALKGAV